MSEEGPQILPGDPDRCSTCGEPIKPSEAEVVLHYSGFDDPLYFHEREPCSEPALKLADAYPEEWAAVMILPVSGPVWDPLGLMERPGQADAN